MSRKSPPEPELLTLAMGDLDDILARVQSAGVPEDDCKKLEALVDTVVWLQQQLSDKNVDLARLRALFGLTTSEKTKDVLKKSPSQGKEAGESEPDGEDAKKAEQRKGHGRNGADAYRGAERVDVPLGSLQAGDSCPRCPAPRPGTVSRRPPRKLVRVTGQAPIHAKVFELERLRCNLCGAVFTADPPAGIGTEKYDAKTGAMIGLLKYGSGLPFNRLERLQGNLEIPLPAGTQWQIVSEAAKKLGPVHQELMRQAAQGRLFYNDDTSMCVLELRQRLEDYEALHGAPPDRTGIFSTGIVSELEDGRRLAIYMTGHQHAGENLAELLRSRSRELDAPLQMCDGLDRNLPKEFVTEAANCLAHGRRKFVEIVKSFPDECRHLLEELGRVFHQDAVARERQLSPDERLRHHQDHSAPIMESLREWMQSRLDEKQVEPNSGLGQALSYMLKRWDRLTLFLRKPGTPLDNNLCERALKKVVLHRKNAYFYKTENGARVGDLFMSLIHSAELVGVNAFHYLTSLLEHAVDVASDASQWMPWNFRVTAGDPATDPKTSPSPPGGPPARNG